MKIFTCSQIAGIDQQTMQLEPIASIDLMERASFKVADWLIRHIDHRKPVYLFAGPGNNGGDALAVARMLAWSNLKCTVFIAGFGRGLKGDPAVNRQRLAEQSNVSVNEIGTAEDIPEISPDAIVIDGLFGSGLNKPLEGLAAKIVQAINQSGATVISIDVPSGLFGEDNTSNNLSAVVRANTTLTFQFPKLSFLFPENEQFVGQWKVLPIGLNPEAIGRTESNLYFLTREMVSGKITRRGKFSHKGTYGHALMVAGSYGKMGAAVLASRAGLRSGAGLLTCHVPQRGYEVLQNSVPEAMISIDRSEFVFSEIPELSSYSAIAAGPGLDKKNETKQALLKLIEAKPEKLVLDADALNILSENRAWYSFLPENTILTPHPKEFERLAGVTSNSFERLQKQRQFSTKNRVVVVLKGAHTSISFPDGRIYFNSTGNPGMATAGSGDVLTGVILGLLAQKFTAEDAALIGVYLHGLAGDLAVCETGEYSLTAGDIINYLGKAFLNLE